MRQSIIPQRTVRYHPHVFIAILSGFTSLSHCSEGRVTLKMELESLSKTAPLIAGRQETYQQSCQDVYYPPEHSLWRSSGKSKIGLFA